MNRDPLMRIAKIARAAEHSKTLQAQVEEFFAGENSGVVSDFESEPGYLVVRAFSKGQFDPYWSVTVGEALYQFRSALDHLACQLTEENGKVVDDHTEFPIFLKRDGFRNPETDRLRDGITNRIGGMSISSQTIIEEEQPFNRTDGLPEDDPLWVLYKLSNFDRHRDHHLMSTAIRHGRETFTPQAFAERYFAQVSTNYGRAFEGETEIARYRIDPSAYDVDPPLEVHVNTDVAFDIVFSDKGPGAARPVVSTLGAIGARVALLLGRFYK